MVTLPLPAMAEKARRTSRRKPRMEEALRKPMNASVRYCGQGASPCMSI